MNAHFYWARLKYRIFWRFIDILINAKSRLPTHLYTTRRNSHGYLFNLPGIILLSPLLVGVLLLIRFSVLTYHPTQLWVVEYTLASWNEIFTEDLFRQALIRTFTLSVIATFLTVAITLPYTYLIIRTKSSVYRKILIIGILIPWFTGTVVRAFGWQIILGKNGVFNYFIQVFGLEPILLLGSKTGVIIGLVQILMPFAAVTMAPAIRAIDRNLERAAQTLGANRLKTARYIVLPLAMPGLMAATVLSFTISMASYAIPDFLGNGLTPFVANVIYSTLFQALNYPLASALSLALMIVTFVLLFIIIFLFEKTGPTGDAIVGEE